jgi:ERCC4-type nuclease
MNLEIDYREIGIIELFNLSSDGITPTVCNLIIGDFIIKNELGEILFVIERKSIKDLCASIIDGRHSEQRSRLLESIQDPNKIIYIIEGKKNEGIIHGKTIDTSKKSINSCILNLIFKHQYKVIFTDSKQDTVDNIILLYNKIQKNELTVSSASKINIIKKSNKINNNIFINMISIIPGISEKIAVKIHEKYNTLNDLILAYNLIVNEIDKKKMLSDIMINSNRKLGNVLSEKIYNSIFNSVLPIPSEKMKKATVPKKDLSETSCLL